MILINASDLKKEYGTRVLFDKVSFCVDQKDKIGFVGVNGAGKSTLFKIITGEIKSDGGNINISRDAKIGYMRQHAGLNSEKTVWDELMTVFKHLTDMENRLKSIETRISNGVGDPGKLAEEQLRITEEYESSNGYIYKNLAKAALMGLGFKEAEFDMPFSSLSGGQQTRVILCKLLLGNSNVLILDEPTNHLDIDSVEWLEGFLKDYRGAAVIISHDRYFLDKVTNKTFELENKKLTVYNGNYSSYIAQKREREKTILRNYANTSKEIARIEGIVEQQRRWNREKNIKTAESKQKQIERLKETMEIPETEADSVKFRFKPVSMGASEVLRVKNLSMGFGDKLLFNNANIEINRGERVFLLGGNGCGKTTLFKIINGEIKPLGGEYKVGNGISVGYFDQKQQNLSLENTAIDEIHNAYPKLSMTEVRNAMAVFLFKNDDVFKAVSDLSGGERAGLALIKLMLSGSQFLLLDEPTNHLDIKSREALEEALKDYDGTMFVISHDRYFINKLASKIYFMDSAKVELLNGDYSYFLQKKADRENAAAVEGEKTVSQTASKLDYKEQKRQESELRKLKKAFEKAEEDIFNIESNISELEKLLLAPENATDFKKSLEISAEIESEKESLEKLYADWEEYSEKLSEYEQIK